jgi:hypothetical protein
MRSAGGAAYNRSHCRALLEELMNRRTLLVTLISVLPAAALAQSGQSDPLAASGRPRPLGLYTPREDAAAVGAARAAAAKAAAEAPHIAERYGLAPLAELGDAAIAAPDRIEKMRSWNEGHHLPLHDGFERPLPAPRQVELSAGLVAASPVADHAGGLAIQSAFNKLAWGGMVRVAGAFRLRLHLSGVKLPAGARLWVSGGGETVGPFGRELIGPDGGLWTPSVAGEEMAVDVELPATALTGGARFGLTPDKVLELFELGTVDTVPAQTSEACNLDSSCFTASDFPAIDSARHAVAIIYFTDNGQGGQCTGQLLNSTTPSVPYMLTANHCISTPAGAANLEAFWDYYTPSCNGPVPSQGTLPRSNGATLLATGVADPQSDFTLMRLNSIPAGRSFLGWNADPGATADGTLLYRLSTPMGLPENFVITRSDSTTGACRGVPRPAFLYSDQVKGGTFGGSSGSAAMLADGEVVAQLYGGCGSNDDCSPLQFTVDGALAVTFPWVAGWLSPSSTCYALGLSHTGSGGDPVASPAGSSGCPSGMFTAGTPIQLTASPAAGSVVTGWSGTLDDGSTASANTLNMPAMNWSVGVSYGACYALSVSHTGSGSDPVASPASSPPACGTGSYFSGVLVQLTASPAPGWIVSGWSGTSSDQNVTTADYLVMPTSNHAVSVAYQQKGYYTLPPCRLVDTRGTAGPLGAPALQPSTLRTFPLLGICGVPDTAQALSVNVTVTQPAAPGFLKLFSSALSIAPDTSVINFGTGQTRANNAVLGVSSGSIQVQDGSLGTVQLILDVNGYFQ